jgi:hypothetical protein
VLGFHGTRLRASAVGVRARRRRMSLAMREGVGEGHDRCPSVSPAAYSADALRAQEPFDLCIRQVADHRCVPSQRLPDDSRNRRGKRGRARDGAWGYIRAAPGNFPTRPVVAERPNDVEDVIAARVLQRDVWFGEWTNDSRTTCPWYRLCESTGRASSGPTRASHTAPAGSASGCTDAFRGVRRAARDRRRHHGIGRDVCGTRYLATSSRCDRGAAGSACRVRRTGLAANRQWRRWRR